MPNHVHVLIGTIEGYPMPNVVYAWKSFTAKEANRLLDRVGCFWQPEYFDRAIRDEHHLVAAIRYIHDNPAKAGLADRGEDWPYSSASRAGETPALPGRMS